MRATCLIYHILPSMYYVGLLGCTSLIINHHIIIAFNNHVLMFFNCLIKELHTRALCPHGTSAESLRSAAQTQHISWLGMAGTSDQYLYNSICLQRQELLVELGWQRCKALLQIINEGDDDALKMMMDE